MATSTRKHSGKPRLTHADAQGRVRMVDVSDKAVTSRVAVASGFVRVSAAARRLVQTGAVKKGDPLQAARLAGIMAAKSTATLIPLCHPLSLTGVQVDVELARGGIAIAATVKTSGQTGVEMEALTAVAVAGLTVYDMLKAVDKSMVIEQIMLVEKRGGRSGDVVRQS
jgi:cyclic pyranopterin phosphate synthase